VATCAKIANVTGEHAHAQPPAPPEAHTVFGNRVVLAEAFAARLATDGVERGLIGPREAPRLWDRHLLNCAVLSDLLPVDARVVDVGSGAGLPGLPLAIRRPDLRLNLVEPAQRRVTFLTEVVAELGLGSAVRIVRGRAEDATVVAQTGGADWVVARAVAPLDRLVRWCFPLLSRHGRLLALKGAAAVDEVRQHQRVLRNLGAESVEIQRLGVGLLAEPTWVVVVSRAGSRAATGGGG
jgi:16S rRNA (guanine527-N7)-methyltransferase